MCPLRRCVVVVYTGIRTRDVTGQTTTALPGLLKTFRRQLLYRFFNSLHHLRRRKVQTQICPFTSDPYSIFGSILEFPVSHDDSTSISCDMHFYRCRIDLAWGSSERRGSVMQNRPASRFLRHSTPIGAAFGKPGHSSVVHLRGHRSAARLSIPPFDPFHGSVSISCGICAALLRLFSAISHSNSRCKLIGSGL